MPFPQSPQWSNGRFVNRLPRHDQIGFKVLWDFFFGGSPYKRPNAPVPVHTLSASDLGEPIANGWRIVWLGHSTLLLEIDGIRVLIDPVFGPRVSPVTWFGEKRFYESPLPLHDLPKLDAILYSHDHYDHLDKPTVRALAHLDVEWIMPLGVGKHLQKWGVPSSRIHEHDWWETHTIRNVTLTSTPSRHFSGRGPIRDRTLWCGWAFTGRNHRLYYAGDSAMQHEFREIGDKLGPFDVTMIEIGAYSQYWPDVHIGPEQAVDAHVQSRGTYFLPVHWGLWNLALHGWTEPIERVVVAASERGVPLLTPMPGQPITSPDLEREGAALTKRWWPSLPWQNASESPVRSTGL